MSTTVAPTPGRAETLVGFAVIATVALMAFVLTLVYLTRPAALSASPTPAVPTGTTSLVELDADEAQGSVVQVHQRYEDGRGWDCRRDGNRQCGAYVQSIKKWYVITFKNGKPVAVRERTIGGRAA